MSTKLMWNCGRSVGSAPSAVSGGISKIFAFMIKNKNVSSTTAIMQMNMRCLTLLPINELYSFLIDTTLPIIKHTLYYRL